MRGRVTPDITGHRFNRWTVLRRVPKPSYLSDSSTSRSSYWECMCDCGNIRIVTGSRLRLGGSRSCGCLALELAKDNFRVPAGYVGVVHAYNDYRGRARRTGKDFQLTKEQFADIATKPCVYCGSSLENIAFEKSERGKFHYTGIDRVDSSRGYVANNCVPCCRRCNFAKRDYDLEDFKNWVARVYHHMFKGRDD